MKGSYTNSCTNSIFNYDQTRQFKFNPLIISASSW